MREARRENYGAGENSPAFCFAEIRRPEHDIDWSFQAKFVLLSNFNQPFSVLPGHGLLRERAQDHGRRRSLIAECAYRCRKLASFKPRDCDGDRRGIACQTAPSRTLTPVFIPHLMMGGLRRKLREVFSRIPSHLSAAYRSRSNREPKKSSFFISVCYTFTIILTLVFSAPIKASGL
jgi:hypothetical protein